jgi:hypothetical protein
MVRRTLCVVIFCLISLGISAQWYNTRYGLENLDDLNNLQLTKSYSSAKTHIAVGISLTFVGAGIVVGGLAYTVASSMVYVFTLGTTEEPKSVGGLISNISISPGAGYEQWSGTYYPALTVRVVF